MFGKVGLACLLIGSSTISSMAKDPTTAKPPEVMTARQCIYEMVKRYDDRSAPLDAVAGLVVTKCHAELLESLKAQAINPTSAFDGGEMFRQNYVNSYQFNFVIQQMVLEARASFHHK